MYIDGLGFPSCISSHAMKKQPGYSKRKQPCDFGGSPRNRKWIINAVVRCGKYIGFLVGLVSRSVA